MAVRFAAGGEGLSVVSPQPGTLARRTTLRDVEQCRMAALTAWTTVLIETRTHWERAYESGVGAIVLVADC